MMILNLKNCSTNQSLKLTNNRKKLPKMFLTGVKIIRFSPKSKIISLIKILKVLGTLTSV